MLALLGATALFGAQLALHYPDLPDRVASHFDASGRADGFMAKGAFVTLMAALAVGDLLLFAGIGWLIGRLPAGLINMPNKDWWLAPERRAATVAALAAQLHWIGAATQLLLVATFELTARANSGDQAQLSGGFWFVLVGYLLYVAWWLVRMHRRFGRPQEAA